ncbi:MAG: hypothetical protein ACUZ8H_09840 [Candidatus Anammoxibacter sp.]
MNKEQAIQDAKELTKRTGLLWGVLRIRTKNFIFNKYTYDTVTEHHETTHSTLYASGKFKIVYVCEPEMETELDLSYLNLNRKARRKLERKLTNTK